MKTYKYAWVVGIREDVLVGEEERLKGGGGGK